MPDFVTPDGGHHFPQSVPRSTAFVLWPISQEGGLATRTVALVKTFRQAGLDADFIRLRYSDQLHRKGKSEPSVRVAGGNLRAEGWNLSITKRHLTDTLNALDSYDTLVFCHACPHVSDKQKAVANWEIVFTDTTARKIVYFSDVFAADYYPWIKNVADLFEPVGVNAAAAASAASFLGRDEPLRIPRHPFAFEHRPVMNAMESDPALTIWTSAWRSWKGIRKFVDAVPKISGDVELFGDGRELNAYRKAGWPEGFHGHVRGARAPDSVQAAYKRATAAVDLTGQSAKYRGHYNRTTIEPMFFGCASVARPESIEGSFIPADCIWPVGKGDDIADRINELHADEAARVALARRAYDWATDYFASERIVASVMGDE